ncbi:hypothetical protein [Acinetobacter sp.]|uniref:hypothetical protein n=1 Tax=Acinetobacter sp. TaxID=472 RepID=UPI003D00069B
MGFKDTFNIAKTAMHDKRMLTAAGGVAITAGLVRLAAPVDIYGKGGIDTGDNLTNFALNMHNAWPGTTPFMPQVSSESMFTSLWNSFGDLRGVGGMVTTPMVTGGIVGATLGGVIGAAGGKSFKGFAAASAIGGVFGAWQGYKVARGVTGTMASIHREINQLQPERADLRASGAGPGYQSWYKGTGKPMPVGHLGSSGDLVFAMHKTRNKSMF